MITVNFHNLRKSELIKETILRRLEDDILRFPDLDLRNIHVTVSMENSPTQAGPDVFRVQLRITGGRYQGVILEKKASSFYLALADLNERLLERLNRFGNRNRSRLRKMARANARKGI